MRIFFKYLVVFISLSTISFGVNAQANYLKIKDYKVYYGWAKNHPQDWMILRQFENEGRKYFLMINPQTLETKIDEPTAFRP